MNLKELAPQTTKRLNKVMESRFGFKIDYDNLSYEKAQRLHMAVTESLSAIKRTHGVHTAEKNPKYMEMLMVKEGLTAWLDQQDAYLTEGELESAEAILAAKSMVDSVQDMLEDASKMLNEQLPPLLDSIRDQLGSDRAEGYKGATTQALQGLIDSLNQAREALDSGARGLAGEQVEAPMDMGMGGMDAGADAGLGAAPDAGMDSDLDTDGFDATDAAVGGAEELGREKR